MTAPRQTKHTHGRPTRRTITRAQRRCARAESLPTLYANLSDAGWGVFRPRALRGAWWVLGVLCKRLDPNTGAGRLCVDDICRSVGFRERAVRGHLRTLEDMGLIEWRRSGAGPIYPSHFQVDRPTFLRLIREAKAGQ